MKAKLIKNLSVNTLQLVINQVFGLVIFYILSTGLSKTIFGQINLALAVLLAVFNILSFGIDQLTIKKIAAGSDASHLLSLYLRHVLYTGLAFYASLFLGWIFFSDAGDQYNLILVIGAGKLMIFFSTPFKQAANGLERFRLLAYMLVTSNLVRSCGLIVIVLLHTLSLHYIVMIFILGDVAELVLSIYLFKRATQIPLSIKWNVLAYKELLRESLPQTGVVLITSALARFDWIFIGFILSAAKLAEYSFTYKIFEISTLPLLAIAPLLIPRFTKMFQQSDIPVVKLKLLIRVEMIIATFVALELNICWAPVIDAITGGKYGAVNVTTLFILSLCMPLLYLNNFLWTIYFAQGRLKMILTSFIITFLVNVVGDVALIPFFKNEGAAFAFLAACLVQAIYYLKQSDVQGLDKTWLPMLVCTLCALISGFVVKMAFANIWAELPMAMVLFMMLLFITRQIKLDNRAAIMRLFS